MTDAEIIAIRKVTHAENASLPWADTLAFARAILAAERERVGRIATVTLSEVDAEALREAWEKAGPLGRVAVVRDEIRDENERKSDLG